MPKLWEVVFQKIHALVGWGRAVSQAPVLGRPPWGAGDTTLHPRGRSQDCPLLQRVQDPSSMGGLGEKEGPTSFPAQDSGAHPSFLTGWQQQAFPGGGGSPDGSGAAGELSHQEGCIRRSPRVG